MPSSEEFNRQMVETSNQNIVFFFKEELLNRDLTGISALNQAKLSELHIIKRHHNGEPLSLTAYGCELMRKNGIDVKIEEEPPKPPKPEPKPQRIKRERLGPVIRGQRISEGLKKHYETQIYPMESRAKISKSLRLFHERRKEKNPVEIVVVPKQKIKPSKAHCRASLTGRHLSAEHRLHLTKAWREREKV